MMGIVATINVAVSGVMRPRNANGNKMISRDVEARIRSVAIRPQEEWAAATPRTTARHSEGMITSDAMVESRATSSSPPDSQSLAKNTTPMATRPTLLSSNRPRRSPSRTSPGKRATV